MFESHIISTSGNPQEFHQAACCPRHFTQQTEPQNGEALFVLNTVSGKKYNLSLSVSRYYELQMSTGFIRIKSTEVRMWII